MKFNHELDSPLAALGSEVTTRQLSENIVKCATKFIEDDSLERLSNLSELLFENLSKEEILFLATMEVKRTLSDNKAMFALASILKDVQENESTEV